MRILAVDPGNTHSGWVIYDTETKRPVLFGKDENKHLRHRIDTHYRSAADHMAIEMIASYGMAVGKSVFDTCVWIGRFIEVWGADRPYERVYRKDVKMHVCGQARAKDANIRQALIDMYPADGGGKVPQVGTKNNPGPLYGMSGDMWAALGVAVTAAERGGK